MLVPDGYKEIVYVFFRIYCEKHHFIAAIFCLTFEFQQHFRMMFVKNLPVCQHKTYCFLLWPYCIKRLLADKRPSRTEFEDFFFLFKDIQGFSDGHTVKAIFPRQFSFRWKPIVRKLG